MFIPFYKTLSNGFQTLGENVARYPSWFIIVPIFATILCGTGLRWNMYLNDIQRLMTPSDSMAPVYRNTIQSLFPMNLSANFNIGKVTRQGRYGDIIVLAKDGQSVLRKAIFREVVKLDRVVRNITIVWNNREWRYDELCVKSNGNCFKNEVLNLVNDIEEIEGGKKRIKYPLDINMRKQTLYFYAKSLGGVEVDSNSTIRSAKAVRLAYFLDNSSDDKESKSLLWEERFLYDMGLQKFQNITFVRAASTSLEREAEEAPTKALPHMIIAFLLVTSFTIATCSVPDWVQGKPWIAIITAISSGMATVSGFGLMAYCRVPYVFFNVTVPFLVLGIGMDDTFILLSSWRRTDRKKSVKERLGQSYSESASSISLTSLTNVTCFLIGCLTTPYLGIGIYCEYLCCCLFFDYIYQVTFVGGWLALFGYVEEKNLHCFTFLPVKENVPPNEKKGFVQCLLRHTGHYISTKNINSSLLLKWWDKASDLFAFLSTKTVAVALLIIYLTFGVWGLTAVRNELKYVELTFYDSPLRTFILTMEENFKQYQERIQVVITKPLNYADPYVQQQVENITRAFESHPLLSDSSITESWLRSYLKFLQFYKLSLVAPDYNISNTNDFIEILHKFFFRLPLAERFKDDIVFNENYTEIIASRFFLQTNVTETDVLLYKVLHYQPSSVPSSYGLIVFNPLLTAADASDWTIPSTLQVFAITAVASVVITFLFLPNLLCAICVSCSIVSVAVGVVGYMTWWGVNVNVISMITLIAISGFCVDYLSHVAYAYMSSDVFCPQKRMQNAIRNVGLPICQGSLTTILCISPFAVPPSDSTFVAMKIIVLLCIFSTIHAILFLPVVLYLCQSLYLSIRRHTCSKRKQCTEISYTNSSQAK